MSWRKYRDQMLQLKNMFEWEKTGEQEQYIKTTRALKQLIDVQKDSSSHIKEELASTKNKITDALVPFSTNLGRRIGQMETLQNLPYYNEPVEWTLESTPKKEAIYVNIDRLLLNDTNRKNLESMGLELPSIVQNKGNFQEALDKISQLKRSLGQLAGKKSIKDEKEKEIFECRKKR